MRALLAGGVALRLMALAVVAPLWAAPALAACPNAGLATTSASFVTARGKFTYRLEVAATPEQQQCGLMYRKAMPRGVGMIFPFSPPRETAFWMENTPLPLDIIYVGPDDRVVSIADGKPFSRDVLPSGGLTANVVELNRGEAARIGLKPGDRLVR